jgi:AraC-like DNA-binding protein
VLAGFVLNYRHVFRRAIREPNKLGGDWKVAWSKVLSFSDPFPYQTSVRAADMKIFPTVKGEFRGQVTQIVMNELWMQRFHENLARVHKGTVRPGRKIFSFLSQVQPEVYHCGRLLSQGELIAEDYEVQHVRTMGDFHLGCISLAPEELVRASKAIAGCEFDVERTKRSIRPSPDLMRRLLELHETAERLAKTTPEFFELPEVARAFEQQSIHVLIRCLTEGSVSTTNSGTLRKESIVARFEEFLEANPNSPLYLTEVCAAVGVAERTLRFACEEHVGMGPIRYLNLRRMHLVRRALVRALPSTVTVTRIATDHGFWELGRFAVAYRTLFGEMPSETLKRPPDDQRDFPNRPLLLQRSS